MVIGATRRRARTPRSLGQQEPSDLEPCLGGLQAEGLQPDRAADTDGHGPSRRPTHCSARWAVGWLLAGRVLPGIEDLAGRPRRRGPSRWPGRSVAGRRTVRRTAPLAPRPVPIISGVRSRGRAACSETQPRPAGSACKAAEALVRQRLDQARLFAVPGGLGVQARSHARGAGRPDRSTRRPAQVDDRRTSQFPPVPGARSTRRPSSCSTTVQPRDCSPPLSGVRWNRIAASTSKESTNFSQPGRMARAST